MKKQIVKGVLAASVVLLAACGGGEPQSSATAIRESLVVAQPGDARTLDPHQGNDGLSLRVNRQIYSRLVESTGNMDIVPGLAKEWRQVDPVTTEFLLREGVKFHDGSELTASDVQFSLQRMMDSPRIAFVMPPIEAVEVVDEYTIRIITKQPFGPLLNHLSHPALAIVSQKQVEKWGEEYMNNPVGTGPYQFGHWDKGDRIVLKRFDDYFMGPPAFSELVFRSIVEDSMRTIGLETGELDIALDIAPVDSEIIQENKKLTLLEKPSLSYMHIGFNNDREMFKNRNLVLAINHAIDKQAIIDVVLNGAAQIATSPIAPGVFGFNPETQQYAYNPELAKEYFAKSGLGEGFSLSLTTIEGNRDRQIAEIVQAQLREVGIELSIDTLESGAFWEETASGRHEMFLSSWGTVTGDADYGLYAMYHSSAKGAPGNRSFYGNAEVDCLLDEGKAELDPNKRLEIYHKVQELIVSDAPDVMLYNTILTVGTQADIKGLNLHPVTLHDFSTVTPEAL